MLANLWKSEEFRKFKENKEYKEGENSWRLVIAPHDISEGHLAAIEALFGADCVRFSRCNQPLMESLMKNPVILIDSIGLLSSLYAWADIAIIGGGFGKGIHNTLEPAAFGLPVVFGPEWTKFREAESLIRIGAAFSVTDQQSFSSTIIRLCSDPVFRVESGVLALKYMESQTGSSDLIIKCLLEKW